MFVWSFRMSKREIIIFAAGAAAFIIAACLLLSPGARNTSMLEKSGYTLDAANGAQRTAFLRQFGWTIDPEPVSVKELVIPTEFNDVYTNYNVLQKEQGFDLEKLKGEPVKLWKYKITNYPGGVEAIANVLIKNNRVVGGDISSVSIDGFMHGFDPEQAAAKTAMAQITENAIDRSVPASIPEQSDTPPEPEDLT